MQGKYDPPVPKRIERTIPRSRSYPKFIGRSVHVNQKPKTKKLATSGKSSASAGREEIIEMDDMKFTKFRHRFDLVKLENSTWCDYCGDFVWENNAICHICSSCGYSSHDACLDRVNQSPQTCQSRDHGKHNEDAGYHTLYSPSQSPRLSPSHAPQTRPSSPQVRESLRYRIQEFNNNSHGLIMSLKDKSTFEGFIRVLLNLIRPINMSTTTSPDQVTSFFLPKNTTKVVHIQCNTTSHDVIRMLLEKYQITDNPAKFALYERIEIDGEFQMKKLNKETFPLKTCLAWTSEGLDEKMFILQENDHCEINWEIFSIPELENFQRILDREESVYINQLKERFHLIRAQMMLRERALLSEKLQERDQSTKSKDQKKGDSPSCHDKKRTPVFV